MKTVVTGGAGFIGSHLVRRLVDNGRDVAIASDFSRLGFENLNGLDVRKSDVEVRDADLAHYSQASMAVYGADTVFHLAARVGSLEYLHGTETAELEALQQNLAIDANVFRACLEKGVKKLVYASSVAVYSMGSQSGHQAVFKEGDLDLSQDQTAAFAPDGGYGWSKLMGEIQLGWTKSLNVGIARIFNIYGINEPIQEKKAHVIGDLIRKVILLEGDTLSVYGDGKQSRDFVYVSDCVEALLKLEQKASSPPITANVGSGQAVSIGTLAEKIVEVSGKKLNIVFDTTKPVGPVSRTADMTNAKTRLGWKPQISIDDGLQSTYEWVEKQLGCSRPETSRG